MSERPTDSTKADLPRINAKATVAKTKWLELQTIDYTDETGKDRKWDVATRTTKPTGSQADAVVIIPLLKHYDREDVCDTILVEQFRPPVGQKTTEFPAGLIDDEKLKKAVRKIRFFLHPDKLPKDLNPEQAFMVKMLWDITSDAWEEFQKRKGDLDWIK